MFIDWELDNSLSQYTLVHPKNWVSPFILCTLSILRSLGANSLTALISLQFGEFIYTNHLLFLATGGAHSLLCFSQMWSLLTLFTLSYFETRSLLIHYTHLFLQLGEFIVTNHILLLQHEKFIHSLTVLFYYSSRN